MPSAPAPLSSSAEPIEVPAPAASPEGSPSPAARSPREARLARQAHLRLRRIGVGSVLAVALLWSLGLLLAGLITAFLLFRALEGTGLFESLTESSATILGAGAPRIEGDVYYFFTADWLLSRVLFLGLVLTAATLVFTFLSTVMVNAASSLIGGLRIVLEEPPPSRAELRAERREFRERTRVARAERRRAAQAAKDERRRAAEEEKRVAQAARDERKRAAAEDRERRRSQEALSKEAAGSGDGGDSPWSWARSVRDRVGGWGSPSAASGSPDRFPPPSGPSGSLDHFPPPVEIPAPAAADATRPIRSVPPRPLSKVKGSSRR